MIVIFCYKKKFLTCAYLLFRHANFKYVILTKYDEYYFSRACAIIPFGIGSQCKLGKMREEYGEKFLVCGGKVYDMLDNKNEFYEL